MKISKTLSLIIPIHVDGGELFVHATPISNETFKMYYMIIAKAFKEIYVDGPGLIAGPRVAAMVIEDVAKKMDAWEGPNGAQLGLVGEINRLANVFAPSPRGWAMIPLEDAVQSGTINTDDASEVENAICFFTLASSMHRKVELQAIMEQAAKIWGGRVELLNCTEFANSLPTLKGTVSSTAKNAEGSSVPS